MVTRKAWIPSQGLFSVQPSSSPYDPTQGTLSLDTTEPRNLDMQDVERETSVEFDGSNNTNRDLEAFLRVSSLANLALVQKNAEDEWEAQGDPTEIAIQVFAARFDYNRTRLMSGEKPEWTQIAEFPFDSDVKKMSVIYEQTSTQEKFVFTKGAVERVIGSCTSIFLKEGEDAVPVTDSIRDDIVANMEAIAATGLRVLALASKPYTGPTDLGDDPDRNGIETDLTFRGLIGLYDPPRPSSGPAVALCHEAGITVHMLTGDHPSTARSIAADVGILPLRMDTLHKDTFDAMVMTAQQFDALTDDQIDQLPVLPLVVARCTPNTKVRMIESLHRRGRFAAMVRPDHPSKYL